jgi:hypothetical protein
MFIKLSNVYYDIDKISEFYVDGNGETRICDSTRTTYRYSTVKETPEQILALIEAEKVKELRDEFAKTEGLWDLANCNYHQEIMEALAGYPEPADLVESVEWESAWRAKLRYIRADAMLRAMEGKC